MPITSVIVLLKKKKKRAETTPFSKHIWGSILTTYRLIYSFGGFLWQWIPDNKQKNKEHRALKKSLNEETAVAILSRIQEVLELFLAVKYTVQSW